MNERIVIVGAGHAGGTVANLLRQYGHEGPIALIGDEPFLPYQRPPLSKAWLKGEVDADSLALRPAKFYRDHAISLHTGQRVTAIDRSAREVTISSGEQLRYDFLVLATGARPIRLGVPGTQLRGTHVLRTATDAEQLKAELGPARRLAVIGGGYIGLEVAASAQLLGGTAVVIEREQRLLARSGSQPIAEFFRAYHEDRGVRILLNAAVVGFEGQDDRVTGIRLSDGSLVECDAALVGVGILPNDELALAANLECSRGIVVDAEARTSDPTIFAIGDCARRPMALYGMLFCPESVPNALEQAKQATCAIVGRPAPAPEVPWNWSDQYDLKLQIAGLPFDVDRSLVRGDPKTHRFAVFHLNGDKVQQVEAVNAAPEFMAGRQLILGRKSVDAAKLANVNVSMRDVAI